MKLLMCNCWMCRYGRKRFGNPRMITALKRAGRRKVKQMLRCGRYDNLPTKIRIPYTD